MTRNERDSVMNYAGMIRGICATLEFDGIEYDSEEDYKFMESLRIKFMDIASDLECVAKGIDKEYRVTSGSAILKLVEDDEEAPPEPAKT